VKDGTTFAIRQYVSLQVDNATIKILAGGTIDNHGTIALNSGRIDNYGATVNWLYGSFQIGVDGVISNLYDTVSSSRGTITNSGAINNTNTIENHGIITNSGNITNGRGGIIDNFRIINSHGTINNSGTIANEDTFNNYGIIFNSHDIYNNLSLNNFQPSGVINNLHGGYISNHYSFASDGVINNSGYITNCGSNAVFVNTGTFTGNPISTCPPPTCNPTCPQTLTAISTRTQGTESPSRDIPEFPYQLLAASVFTFLLVSSYLLARRDGTRRR
jgi:hypothetical protein